MDVSAAKAEKNSLEKALEERAKDLTVLLREERQQYGQIAEGLVDEWAFCPQPR